MIQVNSSPGVSRQKLGFMARKIRYYHELLQDVHGFQKFSREGFRDRTPYTLDHSEGVLRR